MDINAININNYYEPIASLSEVLNDVEELVVPDSATVKQNNIADVNKLECPDKYKTYDLPRAQMDGGAKYTITNNINLLKNVKWYSRWFLPRVKMQGATSKTIIVPEAQGYLEVPTITPGVTIDVLCYYSPDFTSTLLSDNDVLKANKHAKQFSGQSMLKFFDELEIAEMSLEMQDTINNQVFNKVTSEYNHNYGNCILCCTHKRKFNKNVYIPGIIRAGLCCTMPLIIPSGLKASDPTANIFNSREKAYQDDKDFCRQCDLKSIQLIYDHQQQEHLKLINELYQTPVRFHNLPFHLWIVDNTPVNALTDQAHEMIWHQRLIHLSPATLQNAYKYVDGIPNLSNFKFDDVKNCPTCIKANMQKNSAGKRSLSESVTHPYQGLFIDFGFLGKLSFDKDGKVKPGLQEDIEGIHGETAWILISDAQTKMLHGGCRTSKASPIKYLKSFLKAHSPPVSNKFVVLDQGGELFCLPKVCNLFRKYDYDVRCTGADASFQNGVVERAHRTVATSVCALLFGAGLPVKFWSYAFQHVLCIWNALPHRGQDKSPIEFAYKRKDNFKNLKTFGCRIHGRPPGICSKRFKDDTQQGIFLGYVPHTDRLFTWYDEGTHQVKIATHAMFDEGFNDLPINTLPPNCQHILCLNGQQIPINERLLSPSDLEFFIYPFANSETAVIDYSPKAKDNKLGFQLLDDDLTGCNYI